MPNEPKAPDGAALPKLSDKHQKFLTLYLTECAMNASKAARRAGYKNHSEGHRLLQREDISLHLKAALEGDAQVMGAGELARRLTLQAREQANMEDFLKVSTVPRTFWVDARRHEPVRELAKRLRVDVDDLDSTDMMHEFGADSVASTVDGDWMIRVNTIETEVTIDWEAAREAGALAALAWFKKNKDGSVEYKLKDPVKAQELLGRMHKIFVDKVEMTGNNSGPLQVHVTRRIVSAPAPGGEE
jgi:phage terminase small subunit